MKAMYSYNQGEYVVEFTMTVDEVRFIAELIPSEDAASEEWGYIALTLDRWNKAREVAYE